MIQQVDQDLKEWVGSVVSGVDVSLGPPQDAGERLRVEVYLLDLLHTPPATGSRTPPLQISLRYLVTTWAETPEDAHRILGELVFAAMAHKTFEVELEPLSMQLWRALGVLPRPCFMLRVPLRMERPEPKGPRVRRPVEVQHTSLTSLSGVVVGPRDLPLPDARVELPALGLAVRTDSKGRFRFASVPTERPNLHVLVKAKGGEASAQVRSGRNQEPLIIHFDVLET